MIFVNKTALCFYFKPLDFYCQYLYNILVKLYPLLRSVLLCIGLKKLQEN